VRFALMACEEKGVAYRLTPARPHSPEVDCIHPFGKIPVMRYGDFHLFESKAIATFVDRAFPGPKLIAETGHLAGASFTYADINLLPALAYLQSLPESAGMLVSAKQLTHYFDRHSQRASFVATVPPPMGEVTRKAS
jgi:glutathione S-transferase